MKKHSGESHYQSVSFVTLTEGLMRVFARLSPRYNAFQADIAALADQRPLMPLSLSKMHSFIGKELRSSRSLAESMERVIARCESAQPHSDWDELRKVEIEDARVFAKRVKQWFRNKNSKAEINGLWFGIFNPVNGRWPIADFHVVGCSDFTTDEDDNGWAADTQTWSPDTRAYSPVLENYYKISYGDNGLGNSAEYPLCLAYTALAIRDVFLTSKPTVFLRNSKSIGVAVGFDSGDFLVLGTLSENGFTLFEP